MTKAEKRDFSKGEYRKMLDYQRVYMWPEDTVDKLAAWLGLKPGMTVFDIGCGVGYLGRTYWKYYGEGGRYVGVDIKQKLLDEAAAAADDWAHGGEVQFVQGDAYALPFEDNSADCVMCQVLMMHLEFPEKALAEMVRVVKPGGLVVCVEPDNLSSMLAKRHYSLPDYTLEEKLLFTKITLIQYEGRLKLGLGDLAIGIKIPPMMNDLGLKEIESRLNDRVFVLLPPYEGPVQQHRLANIKRNVLDDKMRKFLVDEARQEFLAGGGDIDDFEKSVQIFEKQRPLFREHFDKGIFFSCGSTDFYIIKGRKPE